MAKAIETNAVMLVRVDRDGVVAAVNGENRRVSWDDLRAACGQADQELARVYQELDRQAAAEASTGPVIVSVGQDHSNVWWTVSVRAAIGDGWADYRRLANEGGTLPNHLLAACEAEDICKRLGKRVEQREGFDGPAAKAKAAKIVGR